MKHDTATPVAHARPSNEAVCVVYSPGGAAPAGLAETLGALGCRLRVVADAGSALLEVLTQEQGSADVPLMLLVPVVAGGTPEDVRALVDAVERFAPRAAVRFVACPEPGDAGAGSDAAETGSVVAMVSRGVIVSREELRSLRGEAGDGSPEVPMTRAFAPEHPPSETGARISDDEFARLLGAAAGA